MLKLKLQALNTTSPRYSGHCSVRGLMSSLWLYRTVATWQMFDKALDLRSKRVARNRRLSPWTGSYPAFRDASATFRMVDTRPAPADAGWLSQPTSHPLWSRLGAGLVEGSQLRAGEPSGFLGSRGRTPQFESEHSQEMQHWRPSLWRRVTVTPFQDNCPHRLERVLLSIPSKASPAPADDK